MILVLGKARSLRAPILGCRRSWITWVIRCFTKNPCTGCERELVHCHDEAANHQLPIAAAFWIIQNSFCREMSKLNPKFDSVHCSTLSVTLNAMATQYMCLLNSTYRPHWLVQWSRHCSHMHSPVHSPWLPGYIDVAQTIVVILTMAGLFSRQASYIQICVCVCVCIHTHIYTYIFIYLFHYPTPSYLFYVHAKPN